MKKLLLFISTIFTVAVSAQNYYGTEFIGESGTNNPTNLSRNGDKITLSGFIGGGLAGNFPISFKGGNADGTLTKLNSTTGLIEWIKQFGGAGDEVVVDTAIDAARNYYLTGYFTGSGANSMDADPGTGVYNLAVTSSLTNRDIFIIKLDSNGDFFWAKQISSPAGAANDDAATIKLDSLGNIYIAGSYVYADFDPGTGTEVHTAVGNSDAFIVKLDNDGNFIWVKTLDGTSNKKIMDMDIDANDNIYVAGRFQGTIDLNPDTTATDTKTSAGNFDTFIAKYTSAGIYVWGNVFGDTAADNPEKIILNGTDLYIGGAFSGTVDLDPSAGINSVTAAAGQDAYISKFNTDGTYVSSFVIPGTTSNLDTVKDIAIDDSGNLYLSGLFQNITLNSTNYVSFDAFEDAFYLKLDPSMNFSGIYLINGANKQAVPLILPLVDTKFIGVGSSKANADYDYTTNTSPEVPSNALVYTYVTKFDFETTLSIKNISTNSKFTIYPNPADIEVNIQSDSKIKTLAIYNIEGKMVQYIENPDGKINVSLLAQGSYIVQSVDEDGNKSYSKLIKK